MLYGCNPPFQKLPLGMNCNNDSDCISNKCGNNKCVKSNGDDDNHNKLPL